MVIASANGDIVTDIANRPLVFTLLKEVLIMPKTEYVAALIRTIGKKDADAA